MRFAYVVVAWLLLAGASMGVAASVPADQPAIPSQSGGPEYGMEVTRTYYLTPDEPGQIRIAIAYDAGLDSRAVGVYLPENVTVEKNDGFERDDNGNLIARNDQHPRLTLSVPANETNARFGGSDFVDAGDWAFVSAYTYSGYWSEVTSQWENEGESSRVDVTNTVAGEGYAGSRYAYFGPYEQETALVNGQTFNVIVPDQSEVAVSDRGPMDVLGPTARNYSVGSRPSQVNVFVAPDPVRRGGRATPVRLAGQQDLWVAAANPTPRTLIHEYIHTRQDFRTTNETQWLLEGGAQYYDTVYGVRTGVIEYDTLKREFASTRYEDAVLADSESWGETSRTVDYDKGGRVLAALDHRIRTETDGKRTLMAVFARLNDESKPVTLARFKSIVADVAGTNLDDWLDRYVTTAASPSYPDDPNPSYYLDDTDLPVEKVAAPTEPTPTQSDPTPVRTEVATSNAAGPGFSVLVTLIATAGLLIALARSRG